MSTQQRGRRQLSNKSWAGKSGTSQTSATKAGEELENSCKSWEEDGIPKVLVYACIHSCCLHTLAQDITQT